MKSKLRHSLMNRNIKKSQAEWALKCNSQISNNHKNQLHPSSTKQKHQLTQKNIKCGKLLTKSVIKARSMHTATYHKSMNSDCFKQLNSMEANSNIFIQVIPPAFGNNMNKMANIGDYLEYAKQNPKLQFIAKDSKRMNLIEDNRAVRKIVINKKPTLPGIKITKKKPNTRKRLKRTSTNPPGAFVHILSAFASITHLEKTFKCDFTGPSAVRNNQKALEDVPEEGDSVYEDSFVKPSVSIKLRKTSRSIATLTSVKSLFFLKDSFTSTDDQVSVSNRLSSSKLNSEVLLEQNIQNIFRENSKTQVSFENKVQNIEIAIDVSTELSVYIKNETSAAEMQQVIRDDCGEFEKKSSEIVTYRKKTSAAEIKEIVGGECGDFQRKSSEIVIYKKKISSAEIKEIVGSGEFEKKSSEMIMYTNHNCLEIFQQQTGSSEDSESKFEESFEDESYTDENFDHSQQISLRHEIQEADISTPCCFFRRFEDSENYEKSYEDSELSKYDLLAKHMSEICQCASETPSTKKGNDRIITLFKKIHYCESSTSKCVGASSRRLDRWRKIKLRNKMRSFRNDVLAFLIKSRERSKHKKDDKSCETFNFDLELPQAELVVPKFLEIIEVERRIREHIDRFLASFNSCECPKTLSEEDVVNKEIVCLYARK